MFAAVARRLKTGRPPRSVGGIHGRSPESSTAPHPDCPVGRISIPRNCTTSALCADAVMTVALTLECVCCRGRE